MALMPWGDVAMRMEFIAMGCVSKNEQTSYVATLLNLQTSFTRQFDFAEEVNRACYLLL